MARKQTVFHPCAKHETRYAGETRRRRAEVMAEGGWAHQEPCACHMLPGTDFFYGGFVEEHETYYAHPQD